MEVEGLPSGHYDGQAEKYDKLISNPLYNRIMWGNSPGDYADFAEGSLSECKDGVIADIGCGTLSFTAKVYAGYNGSSNLYLCDLSEEMLKIARKRLKTYGENFDAITFLRADALNLPFKDQSIHCLLSFGIFHIFDHSDALMREFGRVLRKGGHLYMTSLCADRRFSAWYLKLLQKKGHVAVPRSSPEILSVVEAAGFKIKESWVKGGMLYVRAKNN